MMLVRGNVGGWASRQSFVQEKFELARRQLRFGSAGCGLPALGEGDDRVWCE
jgi:hypothetical protein